MTQTVDASGVINNTPNAVLSYIADVTDNIKCGAHNPGMPVTVTYRQVPGGLGNPLVIEFIQKK